MAVRAALVEPAPKNRKPIVSLGHGDQVRVDRFTGTFA